MGELVGYPNSGLVGNKAFLPLKAMYSCLGEYTLREKRETGSRMVPLYLSILAGL